MGWFSLEKREQERLQEAEYRWERCGKLIAQLWVLLTGRTCFRLEELKGKKRIYDEKRELKRLAWFVIPHSLPGCLFYGEVLT